MDRWELLRADRPPGSAARASEGVPQLVRIVPAPEVKQTRNAASSWSPRHVPAEARWTSSSSHSCRAPCSWSSETARRRAPSSRWARWRLPDLLGPPGGLARRIRADWCWQLRAGRRQPRPRHLGGGGDHGPLRRGRARGRAGLSGRRGRADRQHTSRGRGARGLAVAGWTRRCRADPHPAGKVRGGSQEEIALLALAEVVTARRKRGHVLRQPPSRRRRWCSQPTRSAV